MTGESAVPVVLPKRELYWVFGALMLGMLLAALDSTIVSTALPTIVGDLHGANHLSWVVVGYLLTSTVSTPLWGKLGDLYGRKAFFQASILIFLIGSVLSGLAGSMLSLILFRALQGLGGGGLMVGAQAVIGDIVPPRDRGRYAGMFGGVFGAATVLGPLIGGFIVDYWSWRWIFFVNIPLGIVALAVTATVLPSTSRRVNHVIDYLGVVILTVATSALILVTSLGGVSFAWLSWPSVALTVLALVATGLFVLVERRSPEPVLAPHLFRNRVFGSASAIGFVIGFAMFGSMVFLPLFFQTVRGASPTMSGLKLLPLMGAFLVASITVGQLVSKGWRYRPFPIVGSLVMTLGLILMSTVGVATSTVVLDVDMVVLGLGLGLVMQVLITAVQNAVEQRDLGAATAGANFFRSIGGSFGTAVFGALYANELPRQLTRAFGGHLPATGLGSWTPSTLRRLPAAELALILRAIANSIQFVYRWAIPIGAVAVILSLTLPEVTLRSTIHHPIADEIPFSNTDPLL